MKSTRSSYLDSFAGDAERGREAKGGGGKSLGLVPGERRNGESSEMAGSCARPFTFWLWIINGRKKERFLFLAVKTAFRGMKNLM
jgi:hypothetical protein